MAKDETSIGRVGVLLVATRGNAGPGEVLIKIRGGSEAFLAWSERPLPKGAAVLVIDSRGARAVDVIEWDDALGDGPSLPGLHPPAFPGLHLHTFRIRTRIPSRLTAVYFPACTY